MDLQQFEKGAVKTTTTPPEAMTAGYPTNGDPATGIPATSPGAYWYYQLQAELENVIKNEALIQPDHTKLTQLASAINSMIDKKTNSLVFMPVGTLVIWPASSPPSGYLECNGAAYFQRDYANLFALIGTTYGAGRGVSGTFRVPDLRGEFVRGWDHGRGVDSGRTLGSKQTDAYKSHTHKYYPPHESLGGGQKYSSYHSDWGGNGSRYYMGQNGNTGASGSTETRPRNIALMFAIKY